MAVSISARLYADENVSIELIDLLKSLGHDVLRAFEDGRANQGIDDSFVMERAIELGRTVVTNNRDHYHRLHAMLIMHEGIITYTSDRNSVALAQRIHEVIVSSDGQLANQLYKVIKPSR